ncbi:unnamed protein product [Vitrella brassicaformis CCMP3155]|uniref:Carbohydrate kinase PfkB domain-containing protein n=1 Tax=Vitrella brassicaformis (strain CCMP3155) TaxID=1169540 RepID=A0A0G4GNR5_VITBC|nr:unnamed protein product [Vitrella brassicaformis CCMP3155]|eukprot:CEM31943.1 unnamed protein product [Vitrella brassicaformis CCMP3155]
MTLPDSFQVSASVAEALARKDAVVALESTIISHGMPYPDNVTTARQVEDVIRQHGAVPATIGIMNGKICVGMSADELESFGRLGRECVKVSRRDIAQVIASGRPGATTVAATMWIAAQCGIRVFVTGGIGGVHRGAEETWDVSADLTELGRTPVCVVCAGAKSILDLPKTLEYLETQGVCVVGYGTNDFPAFFSPRSGLPVPHRCDTAAEVARLLKAHFDLQLSSGIVVGVPIPESEAAQFADVEKATQQAVEEARSQSIVGRDVTPFLLSRINQLTGGASLAANIALIKHNAAVGAQIATQHAQMRRQVRSTDAGTNCAHKRICVVGGLAMDFIARPADVRSRGASRTSMPGTLTTHPGGVANTIATALQAVQSRMPAQEFEVSLVSAVGSDLIGSSLRQSVGDAGCLVRIDGTRSATYTALLDGGGELVGAVADMAIVERMAPHMLPWDLILSSTLVICDGNLAQGTITSICQRCAEASPPIPVWFEPVSIPKCVRGLPCLPHFHLIKPNHDELAAIVTNMGQRQPQQGTETDMAERMLRRTEAAGSRPERHVLVSCGARGAVLATSTARTPLRPGSCRQRGLTWRADLPDAAGSGMRDGLGVRIQSWGSSDGRVVFWSYGVDAIDNGVVNVTGAGDSLLALTAYGHFIQGLPVQLAAILGLVAAHLSLFSESPISPLVTPELMSRLADAVRGDEGLSGLMCVGASTHVNAKL